MEGQPATLQLADCTITVHPGSNIINSTCPTQREADLLARVEALERRLQPPYPASPPSPLPPSSPPPPTSPLVLGCPTASSDSSLATTTGHLKFNFCWYLTSGSASSTCDNVCQRVPGSEGNLIIEAINSRTWTNAETSIVDLFHSNGNPSGWTGTGSGSWPGLGYAYSGSNYFGAYSFGPSQRNSAAFPSNTRGAAGRQFVCACKRMA